MKSWIRYGGTVIAGVALGLGSAWAITGKGLRGGGIRNDVWTTSLNYGIKATDPITRAAVARDGLLALPATETLYWAAEQDNKGQPLEGKCRYMLSGPKLDARWWSVTIYDKRGYLMPSKVRLWSVNGANVPVDASGRWSVEIGPEKPSQGGWLPSDPAQQFHLTLRMYNPGTAFMANPARAVLPRIERKGCA